MVSSISLAISAGIALVDVQGKHHQVVQHSAAQQHAGDRRVVADRAYGAKA
jgi:hypothetical protein